MIKILGQDFAGHDFLQSIMPRMPLDCLEMEGTVMIMTAPDQLDTLYPEYSGSEQAGFLIPSERTIIVLAYHVAEKISDPADYAANVIAIVFHEMRHLWQMTYMPNWAARYSQYVSHEEVSREEYEAQPLEADANRFMVAMMNHFVCD